MPMSAVSHQRHRHGAGVEPARENADDQADDDGPNDAHDSHGVPRWIVDVPAVAASVRFPGRAAGRRPPQAATMLAQCFRAGPRACKVRMRWSDWIDMRRRTARPPRRPVFAAGDPARRFEPMAHQRECRHERRCRIAPSGRCGCWRSPPPPVRSLPVLPLGAALQCEVRSPDRAAGRALHVGRMQQLSAGRPLALRRVRRDRGRSGADSARVSRRLLGPAWLEGSLRGGGLHRAPIRRDAREPRGVRLYAAGPGPGQGLPGMA